jgi:hypothetical protein
VWAARFRTPQRTFQTTHGAHLPTEELFVNELVRESVILSDGISYSISIIHSLKPTWRQAVFGMAEWIPVGLASHGNITMAIQILDNRTSSKTTPPPFNPPIYLTPLPLNQRCEIPGKAAAVAVEATMLSRQTGLKTCFSSRSRSRGQGPSHDSSIRRNYAQDQPTRSL